MVEGVSGKFWMHFWRKSTGFNGGEEEGGIKGVAQD